MATLHLVFQAPRSGGVPAWLERVKTGDAVLLLGDAVHSVRADGPWHPMIRQTEGATFHVLRDDLLRRGIPAPSGIVILDDAGFVALAASCGTSVTWS